MFVFKFIYIISGYYYGVLILFIFDGQSQVAQHTMMDDEKKNVEDLLG